MKVDLYSDFEKGLEPCHSSYTNVTRYNATKIYNKGEAWKFKIRPKRFLWYLVIQTKFPPKPWIVVSFFEVSPFLSKHGKESQSGP